MSKKKILRLIASLLLIGVFLFYAFRNVDLSESISTIKNANILYVLFSAVFILSAFILRGYRWKILTNILDYDLSLWSATKMQGSATLLNLIMPSRAGDLYKLTISKKRGIGRSKLLSAIYVERVMDIISIFAILLLVLPFVPFRSEELSQIVTYTLILMVFLIGFAIFVVKNKKFGIKTINFLLSFGRLRKYRHEAERIFEDIVDGFSYYKTKKIISPLFITTITWLTEVAVFYYLVASVGLTLSIIMNLFILSSSVLLMIIPLTPAGFGVVELYMQLVLTRFVAPELAGAAVIVYRAFNFLAVSLLSLTTFVMENKD